MPSRIDLSPQSLSNIPISGNIGSTTSSVTSTDGYVANSIIIPQTKTITVSLFLTDVSKVLFIADETYQLISVKEIHSVVSVSGTLQIEKLTGTTIPGSGTTVLTGTVNLAGTINTVSTGTLTGTTANLQLSVGDRLGCVLGGTLTGLVGCNVTLTLKRI